jgi:hypothetical protein
MDTHSEHKQDQTQNPTQLSGMGNYVPPIKPKQIGFSFVKLFGVLLIIAVIVGGVLLLASHHKSAKPTVVTKQASSIESSSVTNITTSTKNYNSTNYGLGINYPADWTVNDDPTNGLTITSPVVELKDSSNQDESGRIVLKIQNQQTAISQFAAGNAIAAIASQKISYKSPTPDQRAQTYLSFVSYSGAPAAIDAIYVTGDNGYQAGQYIPQSDIVEDDPLLALSFLKCSSTVCPSTGPALTIAASDWSVTSFSSPLATMLESLEID